MAMTDTQAVAELRDRLNETTAATWTDTQLLKFLNEALRDVARRTQCMTTQSTINVTANVNEYTLGSDILRIFRVEYVPGDGRRTPLTPRAYEAMDAVWWSDQDRQVSDPVFYTVWGNPPAAKLKVYPTPSLTTVNGFRLFYAKLPTVLATGAVAGVTIDMAEGWIDLVLDYAEYLALRRDRQTDIMAEVLAQYERKIGDMMTGGLNDAGAGMIDANSEMTFDGPFPLPRWLVDGSYPY